MLLDLVAKEGFTEKVTLDVGMGVSGEDIWKKSDPGRRVDRFKSLEKLGRSVSGLFEK